MTHYLSKNNFEKYGYCFYSSDDIKKKLEKLEKNFEQNYKKKFKKNNIKNNLNLIKRFAGDPSVISICFDTDLLKFLKKIKLLPVQTGPIVTHYTSNDGISNSFGLPYHQDFPSMATSIKGCIVWFNINNFKNKNVHGLEIIPCNEKKIYNGKLNQNGTFEITNKFLRKRKSIKIFPTKEILIMSTFLPHRTFVNKKMSSDYWRLGLSVRFDDLNCKFWRSNNFISAYNTSVNRNLFKTLKIKK